MLPKKIRVLGKDWAVEQLHFTPGEEYYFGDCNLGQCLIRVNVDSDKQQVKDTLWHELTHAVDGSLGLGLTEDQVHSLAAMQYAVMKDNPELMRFLLD